MLRNVGERRMIPGSPGPSPSRDASNWVEYEPRRGPPTTPVRTHITHAHVTLKSSVAQEPEHTCPLFSCRRRRRVTRGSLKWRNQSYTPVKIIESIIKCMTSDQVPPNITHGTILPPFRRIATSRLKWLKTMRNN